MTPENERVLNNRRLATKVLAIYLAKYPSVSHFAEDLEQDAYLGLVKASRAFRSDRGVAFSTFAWACVYREIRDAHRRYLQDVHAHTRVREWNVCKALRIDHKDKPIEPSYEEQGFVTAEVKDLFSDADQYLHQRFNKTGVEDPKRDIGLFWSVLLGGQTQTKQANALDLSRERVRQVYSRAEGYFQEWCEQQRAA